MSVGQDLGDEVEVELLGYHHGNMLHALRVCSQPDVCKRMHVKD